MADAPGRPRLKDILDGKVPRLQEARPLPRLSEDDVVNLAAPASQQIGDKASPAFIKSLLHGKDAMMRRAGTKQAETSERTYAVPYPSAVLAYGLSLQRNRLPVVTMFDTAAGGILEADIATDIMGNPGILTIAFFDEPASIRVDASSEFAGQLKQGSNARRLLLEFVADAESYLRKLEPAWRPPAAPERQEAPHAAPAPPPPTDPHPGWLAVDEPAGWLPLDDEP
ncbi:MAG: hypothetical protein V4510_08860 [bacterium]